MRKILFALLACGLVIAMTGSAFGAFWDGAQWYVPEARAWELTIDGSDSDWGWYDSQYAWTNADMMPRGGDGTPTTAEAEDLNVLIMLAWSGEDQGAAVGNRWYYFVRVQDDTLDLSGFPDEWWADDCFRMSMDADNQGGTMRGASLDELGNGQRMYERIIPELNCGDDCWGAIGTHNYGPYLAWGIDADIWWAMQPEFWHTEYTVLPVDATHGTGGQIEYTLESSMVMWDWWADSEANSTRHVFEAGQTIGWSSRIVDRDNEGARHDIVPIGEASASDVNADVLQDYLMVDTVPDSEIITAVEATSWGRIKVDMESRLH
jgi:hypothetical protein